MAGHVVLVGFMGSGKSTVGALVATALGLPFVDLDSRVEEMTGMSIEELFRVDGEKKFRLFEMAALAQVLDGPPAVIASGGGTPMQDENWRRMLNGNLVVHLDAPADVLLRRVGSGAGRPLASHAEEPARAQALLDLLEDRRQRYLDAELTLDTGDSSPREVADRVVSEVRRRARAAG